MAVTDTTRSDTAASVLGGLSRLVNAVFTWNNTRQTRKTLSQLSDRELDDIGLSRGDIDRIRF